MDLTLDELFDLRGQVALVTGGTGILGAVMAKGLARAGARVGVLGRRKDRAGEIAQEITDFGGEALAVCADVTEKEQLETARTAVLQRWGRIDILVNAAGGNVPEATLGPQDEFFNLPLDALKQVVDLNLMGTILPCQVFGEVMAHSSGQGCIITISSMSVDRPLTRTVGYSAAKAGVVNFTRWLAVEMARRYGASFRVNAIAPGFFLTEQNRGLLLDADGNPTERCAAILAHTPAGRLGDPEELVGTLLWLCGRGARFVTGTVVPVDGGFSAFAGV